MFSTLVSRGGSLASLALLALPSGAASLQSPAQPQPYAVRDVRLGGGDDAREVTLLLRDGRIQAILAADAELPPGVKVVEGEGRLAMPAFVDAFTQTGFEKPTPVAEQDRPADVRADVRVDMRLANRKGIQPAFAAVEALKLDEAHTKAWQESGFGAALLAPTGELLAGDSALVTTRDAAARDLVVRPGVFPHAAFLASGSGYPSTLMGYHAQLRQFFSDARRHAELVRRHAERRPGARPPYDEELAVGVGILAGERRLVCQAETARDIERWIKLADEFGFSIAISGGRDAWKVADTLAERGIPVLLTLEWGDEVDDPHAKKKEKAEEESEVSEPKAEPETAELDVERIEEIGEPILEEPLVEEPVLEEAVAEEAVAEEAVLEEPLEEEVEEVQDEAPATREASASTSPNEPPTEAEPVWEYTEPLGVLEERRRLWEETRDCALRLAEAGVPFAFGSGTGKPGELLKKVRTLVEVGLDEEVATVALTRGAGKLLGVDARLGEIAVGRDATFVLWTKDPLVEAKAKPVWVFVDGYPTEFEVDESATEAGAGPAEGVDVSGRWVSTTESEGERREGTLELSMAEDGSVTGTLTQANPMDGSEMVIDLEGQVSGSELSLDAEIAMGGMKIQLHTEATLAGDELSGESTIEFPGADEPMRQSFTATRAPDATR